MPNYRKKKQSNNRNKNKNKNLNQSASKGTISTTTSSSTSVKQETSEFTSVGISPNLPADVSASRTITTTATTTNTSAASVLEKGIVIVDDSSPSSSNEEIDENAPQNLDILDTCSSDKKTMLTQSSNYSSSLYSTSTSSHKESRTEIERNLDKSISDGDSTLGNSVIRDTFDADSIKNSLKTGSAQTKDAALPTAARSATRSVETTRISDGNRTGLETILDATETAQDATSTSKVTVHKKFKKESKTSTTIPKAQDYTDDYETVIVQRESQERGTSKESSSLEESPSKEALDHYETVVVQQTPGTQSSKVIVHQFSKDGSTNPIAGESASNSNTQQKVIVHQAEESNTTRHVASKKNANQSPVVIAQQSSKRKAVRSTTTSLQSSSTRSEKSSKEFVHEILKEDQPQNDRANQSAARSAEGQSSNVIVHQISRDDKPEPSLQFASDQPAIVQESRHTTSSSKQSRHESSKVIVHQISKEGELAPDDRADHQSVEFSKIIEHPILKEEVLNDHASIVHETQQHTKSRDLSHQQSSEVIVHDILKGDQAQQHVLSEPSPQLLVHSSLTEDQQQTRITQDSRSSQNQSDACKKEVGSFVPQKISKVILHQISQEGSIQEQPVSPEKVSLPVQEDAIVQETATVQSNKSSKVIVHQISKEEEPSKVPNSEVAAIPESKVIVHQISKEDEPQGVPVVFQQITFENSTQTAASPLATHHNPLEEHIRQTIPFPSPGPRADSTNLPRFPSKVIVHPILQERSTQTEAGSAPAPPSRTSFPVTRSPKMIVHPFQFDVTTKKDFPLTPKSMEKLDHSSKVIAHQILRDVSSELQSSIRATRATQEDSIAPVRTSFPVSVTGIGRTRPGFFEASQIQAELNPIDAIEPKVIVHPISKKSSNPTQNGFPVNAQYTPFAEIINQKGQGAGALEIESEVGTQSISKSSSSNSSTSTSSTTSTVNDVESQVIDQRQGTSTPNLPKEIEAKVIEHQILNDESTTTLPTGTTEAQPAEDNLQSKVIVHQISKKESKSSSSLISVEKEYSALSSADLQSKVIVHQISNKEANSTQAPTAVPEKSEVKSAAELPKDEPMSTQSSSDLETKEIVHQISQEEGTATQDPMASDTTSVPENSEAKSAADDLQQKVILHQMLKEKLMLTLASTPSAVAEKGQLVSSPADHPTSDGSLSTSSSGASVLTTIAAKSPESATSPVTEGPTDKPVAKESSPPKEIVHKIHQEAVPAQEREKSPPAAGRVIIHPIVREIVSDKPLSYRVESPQPETRQLIVRKSKSFDDDEVIIQEMSDTSSTYDTDNPPVISEAESETDTLEAIDEFTDTEINSRVLSVQTLPMDQEDNDSGALSPKSAQDYKIRRQQNRAALQTHFLPQFLSPMFLDSIKEENSDQSDTERRSECSDRTDHATQQGDLDDEVFLEGGPHAKKADAVFPKSNLDFSKKHKHVHTNVRPPKTSVIREEAPPPSVVEAKIIDQGTIEEGCSRWSTDLTPESEAAEVVYIDSASSSVSDLLELDYSQGQADDSSDVRIQTPTIDLESVNEMFGYRPSESNEPIQSTQPQPPVKEGENMSERTPSTATDRTDTTTRRTISDEIILEKIETMSATSTKTVGDVAAADRTQNSKGNISNSCDNAINEVVTNNGTSSVVGHNGKMENLREIVSASSVQSELNTNDVVKAPSFKIGEPCSDYACNSSTTSSTSSSSTSTTSTTTTTTTTTTTGTQILTLHDLSKTLDKTQHLHPLISSSSALDRQESLDSHASDQSHSTNQSQCTAINQGSLPHCDWNEIDTSTDTTYVSESDTAGLASSENSSPVTTGGNRSTDDTESPPIRKLRLLCTEALASLPYGEEVLEELATVAQNIGEMPYPLPELPHIQDIQVSLRSAEQQKSSSVIHLAQVPPPRPTEVGQKLKSPPPPPVPAPPSKYDSWLGVPTQSDPSVLVCLSPSQRGAVKDDSTPDSLLDMHKKFVERRGYHEYTTKQVSAMNKENTSEAVRFSRNQSPPPPPLPQRQQQHIPQPQESTTSGGDINDEDQNNHRLLAIIRDTHDSQQQQQSSSENISRRTESGTNTSTTTTTTTTNGGGGHEEFANSPSVSKQTQEQRFASSESNKFEKSEMQSKKSESESVLGVKFPSSDYFDSIFNGTNKRFSNIETASSPGFCSQILSTQPKRYSNIETSSYESRKCVENGKVLYDVTDSSRQTIREGDKDHTSFPEVKSTSANGFPSKPPTTNQSTDSRTQTSDGGSENIMSAFKLNTQVTAPPPPPAPAAPVSANRTETSPPAPPVPPLPTATIDTNATTTSSSSKSTSTTSSESVINRTFNGETKEKIFDDFRQRAKEAAAAAATTTGTQKSTVFDHEKLFKDFDDLSNLLKDELESGKRRPPATLDDVPSAVRDYNRVAKESKIQNSHVSSTTTTETSRREQMKLLADEIDRTARQRQQRKEMRIPIHIEKPTPTPTPPRSAPVIPQSRDIPIRIENGADNRTLHHQRSYEIPVRIESNAPRQRTYSESQPSQRSHEAPVQATRPAAQPERFRRAESMFNVSDSSSQRHMLHDDWMKYVGDLGSSENICKPFQREVEICYMGRRPNIRAPRMSASTSDLSSNHSFDTYGAYDVRRTTNNQTPRPQQPPPRRYLSTQSMIDTTPITACVSQHRSPLVERKRRSSLPREIADEQWKYITSKEHQLQIEFERLENERRQLIDEMNRAQMNQRMNREAYRQRQLPPLTEDESFRQQMATEWLDKVAEREERRLQKIIKISKLNQEANLPTAPPRRVSSSDIGDEFLKRVKERRSKLHMPSDSDWESGAESQPIPRTDGSRSENEETPITVLEGQSEASLRQLPKHLREFAKLTSQVKEEHHEETNESSSCSATKKSSIVTTVKTSNNHNNAANYHESLTSHPSHSSHPQQQDGRYPYKSNGYMSEPEPNYDSDYSTVKYRTLERRRLQSTGTGTGLATSGPPPPSESLKGPSTGAAGNDIQVDTFYGTMPNPVKSGQGSYKVQPGRIEDYITGHSSVSEKEKKEQLDQQKLSPHYTEGNLSRALLKEQGYTSDSNLVFRKRDVPQQQSLLSPVEQKHFYKSVQAGGQPPLLGFRKPAPEKPKESPNRYFESDVNIHYKTPIRYEYKDPIPEEELVIRQAESMQKLYQEERRRKYLQELQDMNSRRHTDNFIATQKSPIPLNRYDDFNSDLAPKSPNPSSNYPKTIARALYNFQGQTARELTFKKGDVIYIRRQIDKNWYEGEHNAMIGLLPSNYVELITKDGVRQPPKKPSEGQARAKYNFQAQSGIELSLNKGEHVILTRRVDDNWFEGKIANRKGIFPVSYVEVLVDIGAEDKVAARQQQHQQPASQSIITQSSSVRPSLDTLRTNINNEFNSLTSNGQQPPNGILRETRSLHKTDVLHVDTSTEPVAYRALYKYRPQNTDELELQEGDIVYVLEKCDDGWFVGTSQRNGCFGTFPGNYVERV